MVTRASEDQPGKGASTARPAGATALPGFDPASLILNPMMANPAAAFAAMTQIGIELQTQFATAMFGMMQNTMEASQRLHRTLEDMARETAPADESEAPEPAKAAAGNLTRIAGLDPEIETRLNGMGVKTLADIAGWSAEEAATVDAELGLQGRIERDDWVGQASALLGAEQDLSPAKAAGRRKNRT